jgi:hypothetical protein
MEACVWVRGGGGCGRGEEGEVLCSCVSCVSTSHCRTSDSTCKPLRTEPEAARQSKAGNASQESQCLILVVVSNFYVCE